MYADPECGCGWGEWMHNCRGWGGMCKWCLSQGECGLALSNALFVIPIHDVYSFAHSCNLKVT